MSVNQNDHGLLNDKERVFYFLFIIILDYDPKEDAKKSVTDKGVHLLAKQDIHRHILPRSQ